jgi:hypothetical protein
MTEKEQQEQCVCCRCHSVFSIFETVTVERSIYGIKIKEKKCPYCEGNFRKIDVPKILDKYLFVNTDDRYFSSN